MAGDWIKMRSSIENNPKVIAIAKKLESDKIVGKSLSTGFGGALREIVTRDVTRDVTVMSLFRVWCAANEHTSDGVWHGIELDDLDHVARISGFGRMMEAVGWAVFDADNNTVTFPNFLEYNAPAKEGRGKGAAERQRRYRQKHRQVTDESDVTRDVTSDVTLRVTRDAKSNVEKRREEKRRDIHTHTPPEPVVPKELEEIWRRWEGFVLERTGRKIGVIEAETALMDLSRRGAEKAIKDVEFTILVSKNATKILDSDNDFEKQAAEKRAGRSAIREVAF
jgi:hypothetical protein